MTETLIAFIFLGLGMVGMTFSEWQAEAKKCNQKEKIELNSIEKSQEKQK